MYVCEREREVKRKTRKTRKTREERKRESERGVFESNFVCVKTKERSLLVLLCRGLHDNGEAFLDKLTNYLSHHNVMLSKNTLKHRTYIIRYRHF